MRSGVQNFSFLFGVSRELGVPVDCAWVSQQMTVMHAQTAAAAKCRIVFLSLMSAPLGCARRPQRTAARVNA